MSIDGPCGMGNNTNSAGGVMGSAMVLSALGFGVGAGSGDEDFEGRRAGVFVVGLSRRADAEGFDGRI